MREIVYTCQECGRHYVVTAHMGDARYCPECKAKRDEARRREKEDEGR